MANLILSAFSDEYADGLVEQCKALNDFGISYMEMRGVNGKNVSTLTKVIAKRGPDEVIYIVLNTNGFLCIVSYYFCA